MSPNNEILNIFTDGACKEILVLRMGCNLEYGNSKRNKGFSKLQIIL